MGKSESAVHETRELGERNALYYPIHLLKGARSYVQTMELLFCYRAAALLRAQSVS
ncbi:hypothetical protein IEO21_03832 [Rhodonia placenta]|uniref:Uncharacterized protein n=1 Tax=Rhodonia placenta TaxID=104341 RepID=A0A8H7P5F8_9APHY|nr:hypothetical protein IEO21_03832 [Postia placenta]